MPEEIQTVNEAEAARLVRELLEGWPLYRFLKLKLVTRITDLSLPRELALHCNRCNSSQRWRLLGDQPLKFGLNETHYVCKNCESDSCNPVAFWLWYVNRDDFRALVKAGQWPAMSNEPIKELKLGGEDLEFYRRAIRSRNFGYGLGAVAYLRRVIENRMNDLLDLLADQASPEQRTEIERIRKSRVFDEKISFASGLIPANLRPGGHNPIDCLHDLTSSGLHEKSEDECIEIFDSCRRGFEYAFRQLQVEKLATQEFLKAVGEMEALRRK